MSRAFLILSGEFMRERAIKWIRSAPSGTRLEFKGAKRTLPQNDRMWAMLTDVASQKDHCGRRYPPDIWKRLFMHAMGREVQFIPALDGGGELLPIGFSSSDLSKGEMSELIDFIAAWGAQNGVTFHDPAEAA